MHSTHYLAPHPALPAPIFGEVSVSVAHHAAEGLLLTFHLPVAGLALPTLAAPGPADHLWQHTCCEAFISAANSQHYREFNFSPSRQWAVYDFEAYRQRIDQAAALTGPTIACRQGEDCLILTAGLAPQLLPPTPFQLGLCAVLETLAGEKSYWALVHPAPQPDFHRRESFLLSIPATP